jgi:hypothetical protein
MTAFNSKRAQIVNWEAIGAIAEGLGAVAVVATFIYLAIQIRHNSESVEGATEQALMDQEVAVYALLIEHADVYVRGLNTMDELDEAESIMFEYLVAANMSNLYSAFVQYKRGLVPKSVWDAYMGDWTHHLGEAGYQQAWKNLENSYPIEFRDSLPRSG